MEELDRLMDRVRTLAESVLADVRRSLAAGGDIDRLQRRYVADALRLLEEAELRALLASAGDNAALRSVEMLLGELGALQDELRREFGGGEADDSDA